MSRKTRHFYDYLSESLNTSTESLEATNWLSTMFTSNSLDPVTFFSDFILIQTMSLQKINTFILKGPTNTGKSMLFQILLQPIQPVTISREKDRSSFQLDQLPSSSSVIFEEPIIENTIVGTWKLLMEGSTIQTYIKHQDKEDIHRLPIYTTTNIFPPEDGHKTETCSG
jgi:hypothetical protein